MISRNSKCFKIFLPSGNSEVVSNEHLKPSALPSSSNTPPATPPQAVSTKLNSAVPLDAVSPINVQPTSHTSFSDPSSSDSPSSYSFQPSSPYTPSPPTTSDAFLSSQHTPMKLSSCRLVTFHPQPISKSLVESPFRSPTSWVKEVV